MQRTVEIDRAVRYAAEGSARSSLSTPSEISERPGSPVLEPQGEVNQVSEGRRVVEVVGIEVAAERPDRMLVTWYSSSAL
jgi:hypothetical protein